MKTCTLKSVYIAYLPSAVLYGITAWGNSTDHDKYLKKKIPRIMTGGKRRVCCRKLFRLFNILSLTRKFVLHVL